MAKGDPQTAVFPLGQDLALTSVAGPTYLTAQTLVQQVAYALSDKLFTYSPETFDLDAAAAKWQSSEAKNAYKDVTDVQRLQLRSGAGSLPLGYIFSPDFDLSKRHIPQSIIASAASLPYLRPALDQLSLLYNVASPTVLHVTAVDYVADASSGLVTDYCGTLGLADELGLGVVASQSAYEVQHMSLLSTLLASILPTVHIYDGLFVGRERTRVIDVLNIPSLKRTYDNVQAVAQADIASKRLTSEGKLSKLIEAFNAELGTEYQPFEYHGHKSPQSVLVVFGTVEASLSAQLAEVLAQQDIPVGVVNVRVYRPFVEEAFLTVLPPSAQQIAVLGQVADEAIASDSSVSSSLYSDVLAAVNFHSMTSGKSPSVYDIKYSRDTVWTVAQMQKLLVQLALGSERAGSVSEATLVAKDTKQYSFWDLDDSQSADGPTLLGQLLSDDSSLNVTIRSSYDNSKQGGVQRTDVRHSARSIEAPYSVTDADVVFVGHADLFKSFAIVEGLRDGGILLLKSAGWKNEDTEKKLPALVRKVIAVKQASLWVLDPAASAKVEENEQLESFLLQLAFLKVAHPEVFAAGLKNLKAHGDVLDGLAQDLDSALIQVEVSQEWRNAEIDEQNSSPTARDININSFVSFNKFEEKTASAVENWQAAAKGLAFKEAFESSITLRPDLSVKTAIVHVKERRRLTPSSYDRNIFHIEFDLGTTGLKYDIGEALGIHAENDPVEVQKFIAWYGLNADEVVEVPNRDEPSILEKRTVYQTLLQNVDIFGRPPKRFYEALSEFALDDKQKTELLLLGTGGNQEAQQELKRRAEVDTVTYADILLEFTSAHPSIYDIVSIVSPMKRREYSIASSQKVTPNSVSLLIVTVNWVDPSGRDRFGQATRYLNSLAIGSPVVVSVKPSVMKLPPKSTQPIIMAGLGTGLAPFRAFVQERAWQRQQGMPIGDVFLYMGARHQREEYLYGEEWEAYQDAGIITLLGRAFSRDQPQKIYIQDRMRQTITDIRRAYLREEGAFYLCGPTWPVPDVTAVLEEAVELEGKAEGKKKDGHKEIERLKEELRYVLEVY